MEIGKLLKYHSLLTHSAAVFGDSSGFGFGDEEDNLFSSSAQETPPQPQPATKVRCALM